MANNQPSLFDPPPLRTNMAPTSLDAYDEITNTGRKLRVREIVLESVKSNPGCTRQDLVLILGRPINVICGRVYELVKLDQITEKGTINNRKKLWPTKDT